MEAKSAKKRKMEDEAVRQSEGPLDDKDKGTEKQKEKPLANSKETPKPPQGNDSNGKSTSTDGSSKEGSKSSVGWLRHCPTVHCGENQV